MSNNESPVSSDTRHDAKDDRNNYQQKPNNKRRRLNEESKNSSSSSSSSSSSHRRDTNTNKRRRTRETTSTTTRSRSPEQLLVRSTDRKIVVFVARDYSTMRRFACEHSSWRKYEVLHNYKRAARELVRTDQAHVNQLACAICDFMANRFLSVNDIVNEFLTYLNKQRSHEKILVCLCDIDSWTAIWVDSLRQIGADVIIQDGYEWNRHKEVMNQ